MLCWPVRMRVFSGGKECTFHCSADVLGLDLYKVELVVFIIIRAAPFLVASDDGTAALVHEELLGGDGVALSDKDHRCPEATAPGAATKLIWEILDNRRVAPKVRFLAE